MYESLLQAEIAALRRIRYRSALASGVHARIALNVTMFGLRQYAARTPFCFGTFKDLAFTTQDGIGVVTRATLESASIVSH